MCKHLSILFHFFLLLPPPSPPPPLPLCHSLSPSIALYQSSPHLILLTLSLPPSFCPFFSPHPFLTSFSISLSLLHSLHPLSVTSLFFLLFLTLLHSLSLPLFLSLSIPSSLTPSIPLSLLWFLPHSHFLPPSIHFPSFPHFPFSLAFFLPLTRGRDWGIMREEPSKAPDIPTREQIAAWDADLNMFYRITDTAKARSTVHIMPRLA